MFGRMVELKGDIMLVEDYPGTTRPRWIYCCPVCGFYSRKWVEHSAAVGAGLDHEERTGCVSYRTERLPF